MENCRNFATEIAAKMRQNCGKFAQNMRENCAHTSIYNKTHLRIFA